MKHLLLILLLSPAMSFAQSKSISFAKKIETPYVTMNKDTLNVDREVQLLVGSSSDGTFKYVQMLSMFNEPIEPANSKAAMKKQKIKFFKEQDGVTYLFTKYFVINIEAALLAKEININ